MADRKLCSCGRPRAGAADLKRWRSETFDYDLRRNVAAPGAMFDEFDPPWARGLCWTKPGRPCVMRPLPS